MKAGRRCILSTGRYRDPCRQVSSSVWPGEREMGGIKTLFLAAAVVIVTWLFSSMEMTHVLYS